jgi:hypothetical protein
MYPRVYTLHYYIHTLYIYCMFVHSTQYMSSSSSKIYCVILTVPVYTQKYKVGVYPGYVQYTQKYKDLDTRKLFLSDICTMHHVFYNLQHVFISQTKKFVD